MTGYNNIIKLKQSITDISSKPFGNSSKNIDSKIEEIKNNLTTSSKENKMKNFMSQMKMVNTSNTNNKELLTPNNNNIELDLLNIDISKNNNPIDLTNIPSNTEYNNNNYDNLDIFNMKNNTQTIQTEPKKTESNRENDPFDFINL